MAQVPVDIRVDIAGLGAFRKLEASFKKLDKMAQDMRVQLKARAAERQLRQLSRSVNSLQKKASNIDVRINTDNTELKRTDRFIDQMVRERRLKINVDEQINKGSESTAVVLWGIFRNRYSYSVSVSA